MSPRRLRLLIGALTTVLVVGALGAACSSDGDDLDDFRTSPVVGEGRGVGEG